MMRLSGSLLLPALAGALFLSPAGCLTPQEGLPSWVLAKSFFEDGATWWMARTVVSIQADQALTYPGDGDVNDQVRFKIERDWLYVVRAFPLLSSDDPDLAGSDDAENIVAAYPILQHFDVINGQIIQPPNKEWWEMRYMRVDWARNSIPEYRFLALLGNQVEGTKYLVEDPGHENAPIWPTLAEPGYLDFTTHMLLSPVYALNPFTTTPDFCGENAGYYWDYYNCAPINLAFRTSFLRIPGDHDDEPLFNADPERAPG